MDQTYMKEKPILPLVLKMALPMVISMLVNSLYNIVDSFFVSQVSEDAMTAISLVFPLQNLANAIGIGFGVGINAAVSYYLGAKNETAANRSAALGLILSIAHGILLAAICSACIIPFLRLFTKSEAIMSYATDYFYVVIAFSPVLTLGMAFEKILQAAGKMKTTMFCMAIGAVAPHIHFRSGRYPRHGRLGSGARHRTRANDLPFKLRRRFSESKAARAPAARK